MGIWATVEAVIGDQGDLLWELRFLAGFVAVLGLSAFDFTIDWPVSASSLPQIFVCSPARFCSPVIPAGFSPSLRWRPCRSCCLGLTNGCWRRWALPSPPLADRFQDGAGGKICSPFIPRPAPGWYFAANAATTFGVAFLVPFFFFRLNVKAERRYNAASGSSNG